jgi:hypothetical protein
LVASLDRIDAFASWRYIAAHEQVVYDRACCEAPPPYRYGTDARSRVIVRAAGSAAHSPVILPRIRPDPF